MKRTLKRLTALLLTLAMAFALASCGSGSSSSYDAATSGTSDSGDGVTIEFFNQKTEIVDILETLIAEYEAENPGVTIELNTPADASTVLTSRMASNDTPDIFTNWPTTSMYEGVDSGYYMDLSDTGIMDNIQDVAREQWKYNDGEYAATISYNCSGIWYNKDLFEQAGIESYPTTWAELQEDVEILEAAGITAFTASGQETSICDRYLQVFMASCLGDEYEAFHDDSSSDNQSVDSSKSYAAALEAMAEKMVYVVEHSQGDVSGTNQDSATAEFANGNGAMMIGGSWLLASVTAANPDINMEMIPIPGDTAEETNTCAYPGDFALCIAADSEVQDEAVAFVKWLTTSEIATEYAESEGNPSCVNGVDYVAEPFAELYDNYVTTGKYVLNPDCVWTSAAQDAAGAAIQQLYYDGDTAAFVDNLANAFNNQ